MPRRYGFAPEIETAPGIRAGSEIRQGGADPVAAAGSVADCTPDWSLVWVQIADHDDGTTDDTLSSDRKTADGLVDTSEYPLGIWGWVAQLEGERCCCVPEWTVTWSGGTYEPETIIGIDAVVVLAQLRTDSSTPAYVSTGTLTVSVTCGELTDSVTLEVSESGGGYY